IVGDEKQVTNAFKAAGWVLPDKTNQDAVVSALIATLQKQAYVTVPMSTLFLFGRGQDYGYARAEAVKVIGERDFIASTLKNAGMVEATGYVDRPKQIKETKTATGGEIKTDGRTLVIV